MRQAQSTFRAARLIDACFLTAMLLLVIAASALSRAAGAAVVAAPDNRACLRCHAMATLAYRDRQTGDIVDLAVNPGQFATSVHGEMACTECHRRAYRRYPHPAGERPESLSCVGCHEDDDPDAATYHFKAIEAEYDQSVHVAPGAKGAGRFSCHTCHDPHAFAVSRPGKPMVEVVQDGNAICLTCHGKVVDALRDSHVWLPKREMHWAAVRCLDCHTPAPETPDGRLSHRILSAADSARHCITCHARDSDLLTRLQQYRPEADQAPRGLLARALFNESYVVGMSRNPALDALSLGILALTLLALIAHGTGRYLTYRRRVR